jgi:mono/diheme cytochrome c family protein
MNAGGAWAPTMRARSPTIVLVSLVFGAATAQPALADASKGGQLAQQWCASCHVTSGSRPGNVQEGPPSFRTIAGSRTDDQLHAFLSHPHGAMPDLSLTRAEIDDLIGYIESLR